MQVMSLNILTVNPYTSTSEGRKSVDNIKRSLPYQLSLNKQVNTWSNIKGNSEWPPYYVLAQEFDQGRAGQTVAGLMEDFEENEKILESLRKKFQQRQMILHCSLQNGVSCEQMFAPVLTDRGICFAFNANKFQDSFISNEYTEIFGSVFNINSERLDRKTLTSDFNLLLILDSHSSGKTQKKQHYNICLFLNIFLL